MWRAMLVAAMCWTGAARAQSASFQKGAGDRSAYEAWFSGLIGDYKEGVEFWADHRSVPGQATCYGAGSPDFKNHWLQGCLDAQRTFAPIDAARKNDADYRLGWNSYQALPTATAATQSPQSTSLSQFSISITAMNSCRSMVSDLSRLDCYDKLADGQAAGNIVPTESPPAPKMRQTELVPPPSTIVTKQIQDIEGSFLDLIQTSTSAYKSASNQMVAGAIRPSRAQSICALIPDREVHDWTGTIVKMTSTNSGDGILKISISANVSISTFNLEFVDASEHTIIPHTSQLFLKVASMSVGDKVRFSGTFILNKDDCFKEQSLTFDGAMTSPEFIIRFSDVERFS